MSSNDGDGDIDHNVRTNYDQKARNVQRACDACRRKKSESVHRFFHDSADNVIKLDA